MKSWQRSAEENSCSTTCGGRQGEEGINHQSHTVPELSLQALRHAPACPRHVWLACCSVFRPGLPAAAPHRPSPPGGSRAHHVATRGLGAHQRQGAGQADRLRFVQDACKGGGQEAQTGWELIWVGSDFARAPRACIQQPAWPSVQRQPAARCARVPPLRSIWKWPLLGTSTRPTGPTAGW